MRWRVSNFTGQSLDWSTDYICIKTNIKALNYWHYITLFQISLHKSILPHKLCVFIIQMTCWFNSLCPSDAIQQTFGFPTQISNNAERSPVEFLVMEYDTCVLQQSGRGAQTAVFTDMLILGYPKLINPQCYRSYRKISSIKAPNRKFLISEAPNPKTWMFLASSCICLWPIYWIRMLSREWRCSWSSADRRCSNYIWVINNLIA